MSPPSPPVIATTVVAGSEAATNRLVERARLLHPASAIAVLSLDGTRVPAADLLAPSDLLAPTAEIDRRLGRTTPSVAAAALLPELVRLLTDTHPAVVAIDPSIELLGPVDDLAPIGLDALRVVPRILGPIPIDDRHPDLSELHGAGVYLPTIFGATAAAADVLSWWSSMSARHPELRGALLDAAVAWSAASVCRTPGHGVNAARIRPSTDIEHSGAGLTIDGAPILSIDTSGRDPDRPHLLVAIDGPRALLGHHPALADRLIDRDTALRHDDPRPAAATAMTRLYAEALRRHELLDEPEPPARDSQAFASWLREPATRADGLPRVATVLWHARPDLQDAFPAPDLGPRNRAQFLDWMRRDGVAQEHLDPALLPSPTAPADAPLVPGIDLAGYVDANSGVGEIARLVGLALDHAGIATSVQTIGGSANRRSAELVPADDGPRHPVELLCVNADRIAGVVESRGRSASEVHTIGLFFWETDVGTEEMRRGFEAVDEIWTGSTYVARIMERLTDHPVHVLPIPVVAPAPTGDGRALLGVEPGRPVVLFAYDFHSIARRKNPEGLIEAFRRAVPPDDGPVLVLKSINGDRVPAELDRLRWAVRDRPDIRIVDGYVEAGEVSSMIRSADVYASLHRSEGFGLTIAHAMALGTAVMCTTGSGPADFVTDEVATIVPAAVTAVGPGAAPYPAEGTWWEPDLDAAASGLRRLLHDPGVAERQAEAAAASIGMRTVEAAAEFVRARVDGLPRRRGWRRR